MMCAERLDGDANRNWSPLRIVRLVLGVVGFGFAIAAIRATWIEIRWDAELTAGRLLAATLLGMAASAMAARAWSAILPTEQQRRYRQVYYMALVGKYIPGGIFQAAGQISLTSDTGIGAAHAASSYVVSMAMAVAAGLIASSGMALVGGIALPFRLLAIVSLAAGLVLAFSNVMRSMAQWIGRTRQHQVFTKAIPDRRYVLEAVAWDVAGLISLGLGFAMVLNAVAPEAGLLRAALVFPAAWLVGFLAVPFPAGIGVREGVLVLLLAPGVGSGATLAASLVTRLAVIVADVIVFGVAQLRRPNAR